MSISGTIEVMIDEVEVSVEYTYYPATRATHWQPPEGADIDITSCVDIFGREREEIADKLMESDYLIEKVEEDLSDADEAHY